MTNRNYRQEYDRYQGKPDQKKKRASRNTARNRMKKKLGSSALKGKDVDHKNGNPRDNSPKNLRVVSKSNNRSFKRTKKAKKA